ncbi:MAG: hypothetical protein JWP25_231 [Bradyrhizobium sp.]|jgi:hypothetical protein|nr:hypothetical protein [Bradyrhizobium sp.]MEA2866520.1 hypothetical protein [Bradyrhizobium sp.]
MCSPDYIYGLLLIESLEDEAAQDKARSADNPVRRKLRTIYRPWQKRYPAELIDILSLPPVHEVSTRGLAPQLLR